METILLFSIVAFAAGYAALVRLPVTNIIITLFLFVSLCLEIAGSYSVLGPMEQFYAQVVSDVIFMPIVLQEVFIGKFYVRLSLVSIVCCTILSFAVLGFFHKALGMEIPFEVAQSIILCVLGYLLLLRMMKRIPFFAKDHRFWIITGVSLYYLIANIAFYMEWATPHTDIWWIHRSAFFISMSCFSLSFLFWHLHKDRILKTSERFLLPNWLFKKLLYFFEDLEEEIPIKV